MWILCVCYFSLIFRLDRHTHARTLTTVLCSVCEPVQNILVVHDILKCQWGCINPSYVCGDPKCNAIRQHWFMPDILYRDFVISMVCMYMAIELEFNTVILPWSKWKENRLLISISVNKLLLGFNEMKTTTISFILFSYIICYSL